MARSPVRPVQGSEVSAAAARKNPDDPDSTAADAADEAEEASRGTAAAHAAHQPLGLLVLGALGIVYGDIGTSPLYAVRESFHPSHGLTFSPENVLGILSLIFWALTLVIVVKYLMF